jgi:hypothetical protein
MNDKFMKKIEKWAPPGWDVKRELIIDALLIVFFLFWFWLAFYIHFNNMVWEPEVYYWNYPAGHPISSPIVYRPLIYVMRNTLTVLAVIAVKAAASVCSHYRYFRSGSMSIYTMKRTAKRSELHRRCLLIPGCLLVITALLTFINVKIGMSLYYANIPKGGILDPAFDVPFTFWRMIICI